MSDIQDLRGNIELKKIEAPSLTQSNYGKNIREKFDNIDDNLRRLANRDFVAGKAGKDIKFAKYSLWSDNDFTDLGKAFVQAIVGDELIDWEQDWNPDYEHPSNSDFTNEFYDNHTSLKPVGVKFFDYFIENPDITIMYQLDDREAPDEEINRILICSPYVYTFIDKRYAVLGDSVPSNPDVYSDLEDNSCLLNLTYNGEYPQLERINQFPTLYYDGNGQFRWKLYGSESGILATGPKGTDANSAPITFARLSTTDNGDNTATALSSNTVSQILVINTDGTTAIWKEVRDLEDDEFPNIGDPVIAYRPMTPQEAQDPASIGQPYTVYFTKVINVERDAKVITVCDASSTSIQFLVDSTMLDSMLKTIRNGSMGTACLYIPTIGSLQSFSDDTVVHAAVGTQQEQNGVTHYYLTLKPIKYNDEVENKGVHNPEEAESVANSELNIEYDKTNIKSALVVGDSLEVSGQTNLNSKLTVNNDADIKGNLKCDNKITTKDLEVTGLLSVIQASPSVYTKITFDRIEISNAGMKSELTGSGVTTNILTARSSVITPKINTERNTLEISSNQNVLIKKPLLLNNYLTWNNGPIWSEMKNILSGAQGSGNNGTCGWLGQVTNTEDYDNSEETIWINWDDVINTETYTTIRGTSVRNNEVNTSPDSVEYMTNVPVGVVGHRGIYVNFAAWAYTVQLYQKYNPINVKRTLAFHNCPANTSQQLYMQFVLDHVLASSPGSTSSITDPSGPCLFDPASISLKFYTGTYNGNNANELGYATIYKVTDFGGDSHLMKVNFSKSNLDMENCRFICRADKDRPIPMSDYKVWIAQRYEVVEGAIRYTDYEYYILSTCQTITTQHNSLANEYKSKTSVSYLESCGDTYMAPKFAWMARGDNNNYNDSYSWVYSGCYTYMSGGTIQNDSIFIPKRPFGFWYIALSKSNDILAIPADLYTGDCVITVRSNHAFNLLNCDANNTIYKRPVNIEDGIVFIFLSQKTFEYNGVKYRTIHEIKTF